MASQSSSDARNGDQRVRVWDLPTRLFHWLIVLCVTFSIVTGQLGGSWLEWHFVSGGTVLSLLTFRVLWGFAGDRYSMFSAFPPSPARTIGYLRRHARFAGHNPLAAWSVYALLLVLALQAGTGLFANDSIFMEGPFAKFVSDATSDLMTRVHSVNRIAVIALVALHLAAIAFYRLAWREPLTLAMLTGDKTDTAAPAAADDKAVRLRAIILAALATLLVQYLLRV
jgi:cytochrome b